MKHLIDFTNANDVQAQSPQPKKLDFISELKNRADAEMTLSTQLLKGEEEYSAFTEVTGYSVFERLPWVVKISVDYRIAENMKRHLPKC